MITKATEWKEIDEDFIKADEHTPRYEADKVLGSRFELIFAGFPENRIPHRFIVTRGNKEYAVETGGYDYAKHIHRIK
jgi:hypothetical protein